MFGAPQNECPKHGICLFFIDCHSFVPRCGVGFICCFFKREQSNPQGGFPPSPLFPSLWNSQFQRINVHAIRVQKPEMWFEFSAATGGMFVKNTHGSEVMYSKPAPAGGAGTEVESSLGPQVRDSKNIKAIFIVAKLYSTWSFEV